MYQIRYKEGGDIYYFQCPADSKLEAVEQFRKSKHHDIRIIEIEELKMPKYNNT